MNFFKNQFILKKKTNIPDQLCKILEPQIEVTNKIK